MSEQAVTPPSEGPAPIPPSGDDEVVRFYSHSQIFYYWPLWLTSLVFAAITKFSGKTFVIEGTSGKKLAVTMVDSPGLGLAYLIILCCVILFTSVNIRGVWAALVAAVLIIMGLFLSLFGLWKPILAAIGGINFFLNLHFYLWSGVVLFALWAVVFFLYDRRHYIEFRPTQFTIVEEVGEGEKNYDTIGLVFDKKRDNFFQHWLLGFGSGDMKITTSGGHRNEIYFPNVMMISSRIDQLHEIRERRGRSVN
jgi:hypothetical protein